MSSRKLLRFQTVLVTLALSILTAGCARQSAVIDSAAAPATMAPTKGATPSCCISESPLQPGVAVSPLKPVVPQTYLPVSTEECMALGQSIADLLKASEKPEVSTHHFNDYVGGVAGQGCMARVFPTRDSPEFPEVRRLLERLFVDQGWTVDSAFALSMPKAEGFGFRNGNVLALVSVGLIQPRGTVCPTDKSFSECDARQTNYVVSANLAEAKYASGHGLGKVPLLFHLGCDRLCAVGFN